MIVSLLLFAAQPTPAARDIDTFCGSRPACVAAQRESLRYFLNLWVVYDAKEADAERCMRQGKTGRLIDWRIAERCIRDWSKGRRSKLPGTPNYRP